MFEIFGGVYTCSCEISGPESCVAEDSSLLAHNAVSFRKYLPTFRKNLANLCCSYPEDYCSKLLRNSGNYLRLDTEYSFQSIIYRLFIFVCSHRSKVCHRLTYSYIIYFVLSNAGLALLLPTGFCTTNASFATSVLISIFLPMVIEASKSCRLYRPYFCLMRSLIWALCPCC